MIENRKTAGIYTIGYGGRDPKELVRLLKESGIRTVVDVRLRPDRSAMGIYARAKTPDKGIEKLFSDNGLHYVSLIELGNMFLNYEDLRERYGRYLEASGDLATEGLKGIARPYCLMCAEKDPAACHRSILADYLAGKGAGEIIHIL